MNNLTWIEDLGLGYCPNGEEPSIYNDSYFDEYVKRADTEIGRQLTAARLELVDRHLGRTPSVVDVGIGCGQFIEARGGSTTGFDVNPRGIEWLNSRGLFQDYRVGGCDHATFWDSLEHIEDASKALRSVRGTAFVTMPVYRDREHLLLSKHFKPGEHVWYFTMKGFVRWARGLGFFVAEASDVESRLGREDIMTFVLRRI